MQLVQILLPVCDNDGQSFPKDDFDQVRDELTEAFGGVTFYRRSPAEGLWKQGSADVDRADVVIVEVMTDRSGAYRVDYAIVRSGSVYLSTGSRKRPARLRHATSKLRVGV